MRLTLRAALLAVPVGLLTAATALAGNGGVAPPSPQSPNTEQISNIYWLILAITGVIFVIVEGALILFIVRYRRGHRSRTADGAQIHGNNRLELGWTLLPVLIVGVIVGFVFASLPDVTDVPKASASNTVNVTVEAHQFYFRFVYGGGAVAIDQMVVPVDAVVNETVVGVDVVHGWWVPQLSPQVDAIPGRINHQWFQARKTGLYDAKCTQLCGQFHYKMKASVKVVERSKYEQFLASHRPGSETVAAEAFQGVCSKCHGDNGSGGYGPPLQNRTFDANDVADILRHGRNAMPPVGNTWTDREIAAMIRYLKKTKGGATLGG
jgi:cytochrome c oxidase subunit II